MVEERWRGKEEEADEYKKYVGEENKVEAISLYMPEKEICGR